MVVLLDPMDVLEVGVLDRGLVAAHCCLRLLLHFLPVDNEVGWLQLSVVAEALDLLDVAHVCELLLRAIAVVLQLAVLLLVEQILYLALLHQLLLVEILLALHCGLVLDGLRVLIISDHLHVDAHLLLLLVEELLEDHLGWLALLSMCGRELLATAFLLLVHV